MTLRPVRPISLEAFYSWFGDFKGPLASAVTYVVFRLESPLRTSGGFGPAGLPVPSRPALFQRPCHVEHPR